MVNVAMIADNLNLNGISTVIVNYANELSKYGYNVFVLAGDKIDESFYNKKKYNFSIVKLPRRKKNPLGYYISLFTSLKKNNIQIAHIHGNSALITPELIVCKLAGIKNRIVHSHNTTCNHVIIHRIMRTYMNNICTRRFACSDLAGKWLFGENSYIVIQNGFQTRAFEFNTQSRIKTREELNVTNNFVIGHVGKFNEQKNHKFLLQVFKIIHNKDKSSKLLLIGIGPKFKEIQELVMKMELTESVIFLGETTNTSKYYDAMDAFIFPSLYEGLGIVAIEAQISGLECYVSDSVPKEVKIGDNIQFIPLIKGEKYWADKILYRKNNKRNVFYKKNKELIDRYDINECSKKLIKEYENMCSSEGMVTDVE